MRIAVASEKFIANPGHGPRFLSVFLKELKVDVIIAGRYIIKRIMYIIQEVKR